MTKIESRPYDNLLKDKGFGGFPSLAFMDAEGNLIAKQSDRSVKGFQTTLVAVTNFQDLQSRVKKGEKGLDFTLFVAEWDLGMLDYDKAKARVEGMGKLKDEQRVQAKQIVQDAEVLQLASAARSDEAADSAGRRFHEMLEAGYRPGERAARSFWGLLARWADVNEKISSLEQAVEWMSKFYADEPRMAEYIGKMRERVR
ncbi:MAG: hypothetical protein O3A20_01435, partial [Planctomycetota bacterium]|nr:hypothetical protein [Planctomycetota bacterium]